MICLLCFDQLNSGDFFPIFEEGENATETEIAKNINKYFEIDLSKEEDLVSKNICSCCWCQLNDFQQFRLRIGQKQKAMHAISTDSVDLTSEGILSPEDLVEQQEWLQRVKEEPEDISDIVLGEPQVSIVEAASTFENCLEESDGESISQQKSRKRTREMSNFDYKSTEQHFQYNPHSSNEQIPQLNSSNNELLRQIANIIEDKNNRLKVDLIKLVGKTVQESVRKEMRIFKAESATDTSDVERILPAQQFPNEEEFLNFETSLRESSQLKQKLRRELCAINEGEGSKFIFRLWRRVFDDELAQHFGWRGGNKKTKVALCGLHFTSISYDVFNLKFPNATQGYFINKTCKFFQNALTRIKEKEKYTQKKSIAEILAQATED